MPGESTPGATIRVDVVYALPDRAWSVSLDLPAGAIVSDALARSGFAERIPGFDPHRIACAIYGKTVTPATLLRDGDRLELLRPLKADPKQARRRRAHGA